MLDILKIDGTVFLSFYKVFGHGSLESLEYGKNNIFYQLLKNKANNEITLHTY